MLLLLFQIIVLFPCISNASSGNGNGGGVRLSVTLGDNMVLQRNAVSPPALLWGFSQPLVLISVSMNNEVLSPNNISTGEDSIWRFPLPPMQAGGPHYFNITASDGSSCSIENVLFGDVFLISGQSNAQFTVFSGYNATAEITASEEYPLIRVFTVGQGTASNISLTDLATVEQPWSISSPSSIGGGDWSMFSALGWFFGRDLFLQLDKNVPIGLVSSNYGGTALISWCSTYALSQCGPTPAPPVYADEDSHAKFGTSPYDASTLYNAMIAPFTTGPTSFIGVLWYQGEADVGPYGNHPSWYSCEIQKMVQDWRDKMNNPTMAFLTVVLAPFNGPSDKTWPDGREAQLSVLNLPYTAYGSAIDIGDNLAKFGSYHPPMKQVPAQRLVYAALDIIYGIPTSWKGPTFLGMNLNRSPNNILSIVIEFQPDTIGQGGLFLDYSGNNSHCPISDGVNPILCEDFIVLVTPTGHEPPPIYSYLGTGFIDAGNDLFNGNYTRNEAEDACTQNLLCTGFTFMSNKSDCSDNQGGYCNIYFKSAISFTGATGWQSYSNGRRSGGYIALNMTAMVNSDKQSLTLTSQTSILQSQNIIAVSYAYSTWPVTPLYGTSLSGVRIPARPFYYNITM